jgi:serine/threonine-protein kinase
MNSPYEVVKQIGEGGFGKVFRATDPASGMAVALKRSRPHPLARQRFKREIEVQSRLEHPNVMPILRADPDGTWFAMPLARESLESYEHVLRCDRGKTRDLLLDVVRGLTYAHQFGYVHRDLSPGNVLLLSGGRWVVSDWGLVSRPRGHSTPLTLTGQLIGTPRFSAPEVFANPRHVTAAADIYSVGRLAELAVFGTRPRSRSDCSADTRTWWDLVAGTVRHDEAERWSLAHVRLHLEEMKPAYVIDSPLAEPCPACQAQVGFDGGGRCLACHIAWSPDM